MASSTDTGTLSRRFFLKGSAAAAATLCLGVTVSCGKNLRRARMRHAEETKEFKSNIFITILPTGIARIFMHKTEIGQGVTMAFATLVAEELELELEQTEVVFADSLPEYKITTFGIPMYATHATGGSTTAAEIYVPIRQAAAAARMMLIAAAANQWGVPASECHAEKGAVVHAGSGKSLPYGELTVAAASVAVPKSPKLKERKDFRLIGKRGVRVDGPAKVTGQARFGIDHSVPGMVRATAIHPPAFGSKLESFNAAGARNVPGFIDVIQLPTGLAVVAEKYWQAKKAASLVEVTWTKGPAAGFDDSELISTLRAYEKGGQVAQKHGNASKGMRSGDTSMRVAYDFPFLAHATMEPQNSIASYRDGKFEVWAPCQSPSIVQDEVSAATGVANKHILVHTTFAGGGFGRRSYPEVAVEAARVSKKLKKPVQMVWSRETDMAAGRYRPAGVSHVAGSVKGGKIHSLRVHNMLPPIIPDNGSFFRGGLPGFLPGFMKDINTSAVTSTNNSATQIDVPAMEGVIHPAYRIPNFRAEYTPVHTHVPVAFWRSVGHSHNGFVMESAVDELAALAKVDPVEFRKSMMKPDTREMRVLDAVAKLSSWSSPASAGFAKGVARVTSFGTEVAEVVEAGIVDGRIKVKKVWAVVDCGIAINPDIVKAQIEGAIIFGLSAALDQRISIRGGVPQEQNYDTYPVIRMFESPDIEVQILDSDAHPSGIGEPGLPPLAAAVANAIFRAHGVRLRSMPMQMALDKTKEEAK